MSGLKKSILLMIVLVMILPIVVLLYTTLLFGSPFIEQQWRSAIVLGAIGLILLMVVGGEMK